MSSIRWASAAVQDLSDVVRYIAEDSSSAATTFVEPVDRAVQQIMKQPRSGRVVPELEHQNINRYREVILAPWRLFYRYDREVVLVPAIIDGRRDIQDILPGARAPWGHVRRATFVCLLASFQDLVVNARAIAESRSA